MYEYNLKTLTDSQSSGAPAVLMKCRHVVQRGKGGSQMSHGLLNVYVQKQHIQELLQPAERVCECASPGVCSHSCIV